MDGKKLKYESNESNDKIKNLYKIKQVPYPNCQSGTLSFKGCFKTDNRIITTLFRW